MERLAPGDIRSLIQEKEKELHDINEYRIRTLEALLRDKETAVTAYKQKFSKLQEDFKYNLKLLEGRDEELATYDANFASLKNVLRDRESEISELKAQVSDLQGDLKQEQAHRHEQEVFMQQKLKDARAQIEGARWTFDDELRKQKDEMEQAKRKMDRQMREQQEELETQRRELSVTFDELTRQRETEFKRVLDELQTKNREVELKMKSAQRETEAGKARLDESKSKVETMQQIVQENDKQLKSMEWQLADVRATKDAKIASLEEDINKLQEVKQDLLDEYEGKMAELLQSLHSVERAFVQQKSRYEDELERHLKRKEEEGNAELLKANVKITSLMTKVREIEDKYDRAQAEWKQTKWDNDDKLLEKDREIERLKNEKQDVEDQAQVTVAEFKQQLWTSDRETMTLKEQTKSLMLQIQMHKEKDKVHRQELLESVEKQEELKREVVTLNLRWENKWQDLEQEITERHELRLREQQQTKDRLLNEKQALEDRLMHAENELQRLRSEMYTLKSNARIAETFGIPSFTPNTNDKRQMNQTGDAVRDPEEMRSATNRSSAFPAPSPLWSDDNGTLSPIAGMSPFLTSSPLQQPALDAATQNSALQAENAKLRDLIRQMKEALAQQTEQLSPSNKANESLAAKLEDSQRQCERLLATLQQMEQRSSESQITAIGNAGNGVLAGNEVQRRLIECEAQLTEAKSVIEIKTKRIADLEAQISGLSQSEGSNLPRDEGFASDQVLLEAQISELKQKLGTARTDIERLVKERTQLMELSNQLTAEVRKLRAVSANGTSVSQQAAKSDFSGKKDYENLISELSRSLEEARLHNKTLKKELRRMVKLQVLHQESTHEDASRHTSFASQTAPTDATDSERRRSSTLSMMRSIDPSDERGSRRLSAESAPDRARSGSMDADLLALARNRLSTSADASTPRSSGIAQNSGRRPRTFSTATTVRPDSIPEHGHSEDDGDDGDDANDHGRGRGSIQKATAGAKVSSMGMLFNHERHDSTTPSKESASGTNVSDARLKLQQAKEMLLLAGKKAERTSSLATFASSAPSRTSDRETPSQKSVIKKLKQLQSKRSEMVNERKKVRNYSLAS